MIVQTADEQRDGGGDDWVNVMQAGLIGVVSVLLAVQFKSGKSEYGIYISVAVSLFLFGCIIDRLSTLIQSVREIGTYVHVNEGYIGTLMKMTGVTYLAEFSSSICKDAGYQNIAVQIEIFSRLTILAMGLPVLLALLQTIQEFLS